MFPPDTLQEFSVFIVYYSAFSRIFTITDMRDSIAVLRDSVAVLRDSIAVLRDSIAVLRDNVAVLRDSIAVLRDSIAVLRDNVAVLRDNVAVLRDNVAVLRFIIAVLFKHKKRLFGMKKSKYKGKFSALALKALFLESAGRQYVAELEPYGVTMEFLDEFAARIAVFMHLPSDEDERENANDYVMEKKRIRSELTVKLRYFGHHFREVFGRESTAYLKMNIRNLNNLRENTLSAIASMTAFRVRRCFAELSANGITAEAVAALDDCIGRYITALNAAEAAEDARISATAARVAAANAIFDSCMKICRAGKKAFRNNSAAQHNFTMN